MEQAWPIGYILLSYLNISPEVSSLLVHSSNLPEEKTILLFGLPFCSASPQILEPYKRNKPKRIKYSSLKDLSIDPVIHRAVGTLERLVLLILVFPPVTFAILSFFFFGYHTVTQLQLQKFSTKDWNHAASK